MFYRLSDRSNEEWHLAIDQHLGSAFGAALCFAPDADWHQDGGFTRFITGLPNPFGNLIWNACFAEETADADIRKALEPIAARSVPALWFAGPYSQPADLAGRLLANGLVAGHPMPAMAVDLAELELPPLPPDAEIQEVCDDVTLEEWLQVLAAGYELPREVADGFGYWPKHLGLSASSPMRAFLARQNGSAVASSMLYVDDGIAGIYCVATVPDARRQGLAAALTVWPLLQAREIGYQVGVLQASEMGESVYRKIGFRSYGSIGVYIWSGERAGNSG